MAQNGNAATWSARVSERLGGYVALTTAIIAVLAAMSSLVMARHGGAAGGDLVKANDQWNFYQSKSLKGYILTSEAKILTAIDKQDKADEPTGDKLAAEKAKLAEIDKDKAEIMAKAKTLEESSKLHAAAAAPLGNAVALLQIAIAFAAIAALTKRPLVWICGLALAAVGVWFVVQYILFVHQNSPAISLW